MFRSDFRGVCRIQQVLGKCCVLYVRDFIKYVPEVGAALVSLLVTMTMLLSQGFDENDVFVCESRYSYKTKCFKKVRVNSDL